MIKPREFWIIGHMAYSKEQLEHSPLAFHTPQIHVREVVSLDWTKVWGNLGEWLDNPTTTKEVITYREKLKELVEKSLRGEL